MEKRNTSPLCFPKPQDGSPVALLGAALRTASGTRWSLCPAIPLKGSLFSLEGLLGMVGVGGYIDV